MLTFPDGRVIYETDEEAQLACDYWLERLDLLQWEVRAFIRRATQFTKGERAGEILYGREKELAILHLVDPADYDNEVFGLDHEKTLVHELFHLRWSWLDGFVPPDAEIERKFWDKDLELAIDKSARAAVTIFRKGQRSSLAQYVISGGPDTPLPSVPAVVVH